MASPALDKDVEEQLIEDGAEDVIRIAREQRDAELAKLYPQPEIGDILELVDRQRALWQTWRNQTIANRDQRYLKDELPKKWRKGQQDDRRFYTRLTHNEIERRVTSHLRAQPRVQILPTGPTKAKQAEKEQRWSNQLIDWMSSGLEIDQRERFIDGLYDCGLSAYEVYLTGAYDDLDLEPKLIRDRKTGETREETDREIERRLEEQMRGRRPFGIRWVDGLAVYTDQDEQGTSRAVIVERKPYPQVYREMLKRGTEIADKETLKEHGQAVGWTWPEDVPADEANLVTTVRYYDRRWYCLLVDGAPVDGPREHLLPGVPVFPAYGRTTSASNLADAVQGATWGMQSLELFLNDQLTIASDVAFTYRRPKFVVKTPIDGAVPEPASNGAPPILDLSGDGAPYTPPGAEVVNILQGFTPMLQAPMVQLALQFWGRSAVNPVAQGEAPGANAAGYTVAALTSNAEEVDTTRVKAEEKAWGRVVDFVRRMVRDTIGDTVYLTAPVEDATGGDSVEWIGLGPKDVSESPAIVKVDLGGDQNKLAKRQSLLEGNARGVVTRRRLQVEGYDVKDPDVEDFEIAVEQVMDQIKPWILKQAIATVGLMMQDEQAQMQGGGAPVDPAAMRANGGAPAPVQPPSVGGDLAAASQVSGVPGQAQMANAGQGNGYMPLPVRQ